MTEPLDLEPIRARLALFAEKSYLFDDPDEWPEDVQALIQEVERLRGEYEPGPPCGVAGSYEEARGGGSRATMITRCHLPRGHEGAHFHPFRVHPGDGPVTWGIVDPYPPVDY